MQAANESSRLADPAHALIVSQNRLLKLQIGSERIAVGLKLLLGLAGLMVAVGFGAMVWEAAHSRGLVVDSFQVPPSLTQRGLTGEVVAGKIIDRLTDMRANTDSSRASDALESGWRKDYRVEIPQTGIAIGEIRTALRRWLGSDTHVGGEVYLTPDGMALTVRTDKGSSATFTGKEGEADRLADKAADDIYAKTAPYLHAVYMQNQGRTADAMAALRRLSETATDDTDRAWALSGLGNATSFEGHCEDAIPILERAIALDPRLPNPVANLASAHSCLGHDQIAADLTRKEAALWQEGHLQNPARIQRNRLQSEIDEAEQAGDFRRELGLHIQLEWEGAGPQTINRAALLALTRDVSASKRMLSQFRADAFTDWDRFSYWTAKSVQAWAIADWSSEARFAKQAMRVAERLDRFSRRKRQAWISA